MFSFLNYVVEIFNVSKAQKVDIGVAFSKFKTDVWYGNAHEYNTGDVLTEFDFASAKKEFDKLTEREQLFCYDEWHEFIASKYSQVCEAYPDRHAIKAIVNDFRG
jgi:hypothetical protein